ncbi:MAG TPA: radical SAM protein [Verrucomicrobiae bacterium]|jgi:wyosine [tRNA(Phe)-imidazoG37] synthetase (radical SAM superfamily)|nr:radical SAM protein [Verrucomicrobiae bacterium]
MLSTEVNAVSSPPTALSQSAGPGCGRKNRTNDPFALKRDFLGNQFVYLAISPRAHGLSIGVNFNPDAGCNFDCLYCDVDRLVARPDRAIDCDLVARELEQTLTFVHNGGLKNLPPYRALPLDLLRLRHVCLSGDGEPTGAPQFLELLQTVIHVRARGLFPFFKIVLITNASHLDSPDVQNGLTLFTTDDEVWAKLDAGTQSYMDLINRSNLPIEQILENILRTARRRPVIIQSLFSSIDNVAPDAAEIAAFAERLKALKQAGANIPLVQIYSATRPTASTRVAHLPLRTMSEIANAVRTVAGLRAEVF